jgi:hypothetical protein
VNLLKSWNRCLLRRRYVVRCLQNNMFCCPVLPTDEQVQRLSTELILSLPVLNRDVFCCYIFLFDHTALTEGHTQGRRNRGAGARGQGPQVFRKHKKCPISGGKRPLLSWKMLFRLHFIWLQLFFLTPPPPSLTFPGKISGACPFHSKNASRNTLDYYYIYI